MTERRVSPSGHRSDDPKAVMEDELFRAAADAWRREHDLWRRRVERADDQAAGFLAVDITALVALATVVGVVLGGVPATSKAFLFLIVGGAALLVALCQGALVRATAWSVPRDEQEEYDSVTRRLSLWPVRPRGEPPWSPVSDRLFVSEAAERPDWAEFNWRDWLLAVERRRTISLRGQVERKETMLQRAVLAWPVGTLLAIVGILVQAL